MTSNSQIQLIVGLGNPGPRYELTRHNVGEWFVDLLAEQTSTRLLVEPKLHCRIGKWRLDSHDCWLMVPTTFMNLSGQAVQAVAQFYKIAPESILVAHDELDFAPGIIRIKENGGHGGHNGLRDIINRLQQNDFSRVRIGIGHPGDRNRVTDYVLSQPSRHEHEEITTAIDNAAMVIVDYLTGERQKAIQKLHNNIGAPDGI